MIPFCFESYAAGNVYQLCRHKLGQRLELIRVKAQQLRSELLKYCELDTLAMVMLYEAWQDWIE